MKRFHVHVAVKDLTQSVRFYSTLFAAEPTVIQTDYAKWMLDNPRVNFAISQRADNEQTGVQHLGIQAEDESELVEVFGRLAQAERPVLEQAAVTCCYAQGEKQWVSDPQDVAWETFLTTGSATVYGEGGTMNKLKNVTGAVCCEPKMPAPSPAKASKCGCAA